MGRYHGDRRLVVASAMPPICWLLLVGVGVVCIILAMMIVSCGIGASGSLGERNNANGPTSRQGYYTTCIHSHIQLSLSVFRLQAHIHGFTFTVESVYGKAFRSALVCVAGSFYFWAIFLPRIAYFSQLGRRWLIMEEDSADGKLWF
jgi:hypothetical protein